MMRPEANDGERIKRAYSLVTLPFFHKILMRVLGSDNFWKRYSTEILAVQSGMKILDLGCGTATALNYLPGEIDYTGVDLNPRHVEFAEKNYQGNFVAADAVSYAEAETRSFDLICMTGLLHHLTDDQCRQLLRRAHSLLNHGGRIASIDPVWLQRERPISYAIKRMDSGLNIRTAERYVALCDNMKPTTRVYSDLLNFPYDQLSMVISREP